LALNYLLHRHQVSLARSERSATAEGRIAHGKLASLYAQRIREMTDASCGGALIAAAAR